MTRRFPILVLGLAALVGACEAEPASTASLEGRVELVERSVEEIGLDAPPRRRVAFELADGTDVPVDRLAIGFVPRWRDGAALVDPEGRLYEVTPDGARRMLSADATGTLAVSDDATLLAFVVASGIFGELRVHDGAQARTLARDLASIGVLRFLSNERVAFVGARPGGIVGVWIAAPDGARCLSNCELRTGEPFLDRFVPPPSEGSSFVEEEGVLRWADADGATHSRELADDGTVR